MMMMVFEDVAETVPPVQQHKHKKGEKHPAVKACKIAAGISQPPSHCAVSWTSVKLRRPS